MPETLPPSILYKYLPPERIDIIESMELRFSRPSEFNDRFDSRYLLPSDLPAKARTERIKLKARVGVLCLSERDNDHLMWVNYAHDHAGFVLGFNARSRFFRDDDRILRRVEYQRRPPVLPDASADGCFFKSDTWSYEREWRCVREFESSESRNVPIEPRMIREIIFGSLMEPWHIARIMLFVTAHEIQPVFKRSTALHAKWKFENRRKDVALCQECGGDGFKMTDAAED